jgi:hypothetical protein
MANENANHDANNVPAMLGVDDVTGETRKILTDADGNLLCIAAVGGAGTVTDVSVVSANGFAGSVATSTTTPAITLSTTITGILQGNGTAISAATTTGTGSVVLATTPTLVTPVLGVATATSINKVAVTAPATSATLTLADGSTFATSGAFSLTLTSTGATNVTLPTTGTLATLAGSEALTNKSINGLTVTSTTGTLTLAASSTLATSGAFSITLTSTAGTNVTLPTTGTLSTLAGTEELTNKTLNASVGKGTWTASGTWTLPALTLGGDVQLSENVSFLLDAALSVDGKYCGISETGVAGEALSFGNTVYFKAADSRWYLTDADADATAGAVMVGICVLAAAGAASTTTVLRYGKIRADAVFPALTIGAPVYLSTTAGAVQTAQPSGVDDVIRIVGYGITADEMLWNPSNDYITHT